MHGEQALRAGERLYAYQTKTQPQHWDAGGWARPSWCARPRGGAGGSRAAAGGPAWAAAAWRSPPTR